MTFFQKNSVTVIVIRDGKVLVNLRDDIEEIWAPDQWSFIGGHVEEGETLQNALIREVREETGQCLNPDSLHTLCTYRYDAVGVVTTMFFYRAYNWEFTSVECNEGREMKWVHLDEIIACNISSEVTGRYHRVADDHVYVAREFRKWLH